MSLLFWWCCCFLRLTIGCHIWWDHLWLFLPCILSLPPLPALLAFHRLSHTYWTEISIYGYVMQTFCAFEKCNKTGQMVAIFVDSDALAMACQKSTYICWLLKSTSWTTEASSRFCSQIIWNSKQQKIKSAASIIFMFQSVKGWEHMWYSGMHITRYLIPTIIFIVIYNWLLCKNLFVAYGNIYFCQYSVAYKRHKPCRIILFAFPHSFHLEKNTEWIWFFNEILQTTKKTSSSRPMCFLGSWRRIIRKYGEATINNTSKELLLQRRQRILFW